MLAVSVEGDPLGEGCPTDQRRAMSASGYTAVSLSHHYNRQDRAVGGKSTIPVRRIARAIPPAMGYRARFVDHVHKGGRVHFAAGPQAHRAGSIATPMLVVVERLRGCGYQRGRHSCLGLSATLTPLVRTKHAKAVLAAGGIHSQHRDAQEQVAPHLDAAGQRWNRRAWPRGSGTTVDWPRPAPARGPPPDRPAPAVGRRIGVRQVGPAQRSHG